MEQPTLWLSFVAGLLSFLSPCCLPLYPSYISYISGVTFNEIQDPILSQRMKALSHTFFFVVGFSLVFFALGFSATFIGKFFASYHNAIRIIGGIIITFLGLFLSQLIRPKWFMMEKRWEFHNNPSGYLGSVLVGISFAAGWTPCIGPILGSVLVLSATHPSTGILLTLTYILGFAVPFFILGFALGSVHRLTRFAALLSRISGYFMILLGFLLTTNLMSRITILLIKVFGGFIGF